MPRKEKNGKKYDGPEKLNDKHIKFCKEFIKDFNGSRAARAAGYSAKNSRQTAAKFLTFPNIQKQIKIEADKMNQETDNDIRKIITELQIIAFGDIKDICEWDEEVIRLKESETLDEKSRAINEVSETKVGTKVKMHDKLRALEMLGRYHSIFKDNVDLSNKDETLKPQVNIYVPSNKREANNGSS